MKAIDTVGDRSQGGCCTLEDCFVKYLDTVQISPLLFCVKCPMCPLLSACQAGNTVRRQGRVLPRMSSYLGGGRGSHHKSVTALHCITKDVFQASTHRAGLANCDTVSLCSYSSLLLDRGLNFAGCVIELRFYTVVFLIMKTISVCFWGWGWGWGGGFDAVTVHT